MNNIAKMFVSWIAVDWGTSNVRLWIMGSNKLIHFRQEPLGMININQNDYGKLLLDKLKDLKALFNSVGEV